MIKLSKPNIDHEDIERLIETVTSGNLVYGAKGRQFETKISNLLNVNRSISVSSGTAALHLACLALGIGPGDTVLVPAFSFPATANAVAMAGARICFVDVEYDTYCISERTVKESLASLKSEDRDQLKAIIPVHEFGYPAPVTAIQGLLSDLGVSVIEDAACALGASLGGKPVGTLGDVGCFSFHPRKTVTTGEGGVVISSREVILNRIERLKNHGISIDGQSVEFLEPGLNYRLPDINAALAIGQLDKLASWISQRRELAKIYKQRLAGIDEITPPRLTEGHSWQTFMVLLDEKVDQKQIVYDMRELGIEVNIGAYAIPNLSAYRNNLSENRFQNATKLHLHGLALPFCEQYDEDTVKKVVSGIKACLIKQL